MKYTSTLLPIILSFTLAASLVREVSLEERLRDHLSTFRQVFHGNKQIYSFQESFQNPSINLPSSLETSSYSQDDYNKNPLAQIQNLAGPGYLTDTNRNEFIGVVPGIKSATPEEIGNPEPEGKFHILPISTKQNEPSIHVNFEIPSDIKNMNRAETKRKDKQPRSLPKPLVSKENPEDKDAKKELSKSKEWSPRTTQNQTISKKIQGNSTTLNQENNRDSQPKKDEKVTEKQGNFSEKFPNDKLLQNLNQTIPQDTAIEKEDYFGDERVSSLLADGLKELLRNETNYSAVFEFPQFQKTPLPTTTLTPSTFPSPSPSTNNLSIILTTTKSLETPSSTFTGNYSNFNSTQKQFGTIGNEHPGNNPEGKTNLKSVLDMTSKMRTLPLEPGRHKKARNPKTYVEPVNSTEMIEPPKKLHLKTLLDQDSLSEQQEPLIKPMVTNEPKNGNDILPGKIKQGPGPGKPSLSEIRQIYFRSLEREENEDLINYFQRIYPELHHLLGNAPVTETDLASDTQLRNFLGNLKNEIVKSELPTVVHLPPANGKEISGKTSVFEKKEPIVPTKTKSPMDTDPLTESIQFKTSHDFKPRLYSNSTRNAKAEHVNFINRISETLHKLKSENFFYHHFDQSVTSEASKKSEIYPSVIGAVIFALFLILL